MMEFKLPTTIAEACGIYKNITHNKNTKNKRFKAIVATMKTSSGNVHYCRIVHPDIPDDVSPLDDDWYMDVHSSKYKGRMEYEAACLNRFFNLPESIDEYINILDFDGDNIDKV